MSKQPPWASPRRPPMTETAQHAQSIDGQPLRYQTVRSRTKEMVFPGVYWKKGPIFKGFLRELLDDNKDQSHNITSLGREPSGASPYAYLHQVLEFKVSSPLPDAWKWSGCCRGRRKGRLRRQMVSPICLSLVSSGKATQGQEHRQKRSWCHQLQKPRWFKCLWQRVGPRGGKRLRKERSLIATITQGLNSTGLQETEML